MKKWTRKEARQMGRRESRKKEVIINGQKRNVDESEEIKKDHHKPGRKKKEKKMIEPNLCNVMPCEFQKSSAPHFICLRHFFFFGRQFLIPSSIMYVRSLVTLNQERSKW